jgi:ABC-type multidrug transport system fused ATPase/permease subunit
LLTENWMKPLPEPVNPELHIELRNASFAWDAIMAIGGRPQGKPGGPPAGKPATAATTTTPKPEEGDTERNLTVVRNVSVAVPVGQLVGICGKVGSGKSSLLSALLGQMKLVAGDAMVHNNMAYVSQQAWIQSISLRDNILFGKPMDEELYNKVLDVCCLRPDLEILPAGDLTDIGAPWCCSFWPLVVYAYVFGVHFAQASAVST